MYRIVFEYRSAKYLVQKLHKGHWIKASSMTFTDLHECQQYLDKVTGK
jgi:hypothetical protein